MVSESEGNKMMKCIRCGSSAQVSFAGYDYDFYSGKIWCYFECRCGCAFKATFDLSELKPIKAEDENKE